MYRCGISMEAEVFVLVSFHYLYLLIQDHGDLLEPVLAVFRGQVSGCRGAPWTVHHRAQFWYQDVIAEVRVCLCKWAN